MTARKKREKNQWLIEAAMPEYSHTSSFNLTLICRMGKDSNFQSKLRNN